MGHLGVVGLLGSILAGVTVSADAIGQGSASPPRVRAEQASDRIPEPPREFRGVWVATVHNIDWPRARGETTAKQQASLRELMDRAAALRLNAVVFQVRPAGDALYASDLEPWSEFLTGAQGRAPKPLWDPLEFAVHEAHARGLQLHAWFNPYRAVPKEPFGPRAKSHVTSTTDWIVSHGKQKWMDPGHPAARAHSLAVIQDVTKRYDIDGVHLDDYFYPYPVQGVKFRDEASYAAYQQRGGALNKSDWRRDNVNKLVAELDAMVARVRPQAMFGISPFGIVRPGVPKGIRAGVDQYEGLSADVLHWVREGYLDYLAPQLYWPIAQKAQAFPVLLDYWAKVVGTECHLWPGLYSGKASKKAKGWTLTEIDQQLARIRNQPVASGAIHFSARALLRDWKGGKPSAGSLAADLDQGAYFQPALVPLSPWLDAKSPAGPRMQATTSEDGALVVTFGANPDAYVRTVWLSFDGVWQLSEVRPGRLPGLRLPAKQIAALHIDRVAVAAVDRLGNASARVVVELGRSR